MKASVILFSAAALMMNAASTAGDLPPDSPRIAVMLDFSGTMVRFHQPLPTETQIRPLLEALVSTGGEFQEFRVTESGRSIGPWMTLPAPLPQPQPPAASGNPFSTVDAARRQKYLALRRDYEAGEAHRRDECKRRIDAFLAEIRPDFHAQRNAGHSCVREALHFAMRYLNAPQATPGRAPLRLLLAITDGHDESPPSPRFELPDGAGVQVLWVNPDPTPRILLLHADPRMFVTTDQALGFTLQVLRSAHGQPSAMEGEY